MKPKILKDLVREKVICKSCAWEIKQVIIKWIKFHHEDEEPRVCMLNGWLKHFGSVTKEDLK